MPTKREREYYRMGWEDGYKSFGQMASGIGIREEKETFDYSDTIYRGKVSKPKRKLSAWNKFVRANSRKKEFRYRDGKLNLKKMGVAFRRKKRR